MTAGGLIRAEAVQIFIQEIGLPDPLAKVVEAKHDYENLEELYPEQQEPIRTVLNLITGARQLSPLTDGEIWDVL